MASFERNFRTLDDPALEKIRARAERYVADMLDDIAPRWLTFVGDSGTGKTLLARIIYRIYRWKFDDEIDWPRSKAHGSHIFRFRCGFINWGNAINQRMLRGEYEFLDDMRAFDFFVIDDISSEYVKHRDLSAAKLYDVLEARLGKWTVITANVSLEQIADQLDQRVASRMLRGGSDVIQFDVPDYSLRGIDGAPLGMA